LGLPGAERGQHGAHVAFVHGAEVVPPEGLAGIPVHLAGENSVESCLVEADVHASSTREE
jgi:hypothetical protein